MGSVIDSLSRHLLCFVQFVKHCEYGVSIVSVPAPVVVNLETGLICSWNYTLPVLFNRGAPDQLQVLELRFVCFLHAIGREPPTADRNVNWQHGLSP